MIELMTPAVLLAGFEPEDESPIVFLRLRKAARKDKLAVFSVALFPQFVPARTPVLPSGMLCDPGHTGVPNMCSMGYRA